MGPAGTETGPSKTISHYGCGAKKVGRAGLCAGLMQNAFSGAGNEFQMWY